MTQVPLSRAIDHSTHERPTQWRSIPALAEIINAGAEQHTLSEHALRHYVRCADSNGLRPHVRRLGRKILINEQGFLEWIDRRPASRTDEDDTPQEVSR